MGAASRARAAIRAIASAIASSADLCAIGSRQIPLRRILSADRKHLAKVETELAQKLALASDREAEHPWLVLRQVQEALHERLLCASGMFAMSMRAIMSIIAR